MCRTVSPPRTEALHRAAVLRTSAACSAQRQACARKRKQRQKKNAVELRPVRIVKPSNAVYNEWTIGCWLLAIGCSCRFGFGVWISWILMLTARERYRTYDLVSPVSPPFATTHEVHLRRDAPVFRCFQLPKVWRSSKGRTIQPSWSITPTRSFTTVCEKQKPGEPQVNAGACQPEAGSSVVYRTRTLRRGLPGRPQVVT